MLYLGANSLSIRLRAYTPFLQLVLVVYHPFYGGWCCRHPWTQEKPCSNKQYCGLHRPSIVQSVGKLPCSDAILLILVRMKLLYLLAQQRYYSNQHYCRRDLPPIVRTVGQLPCSGVTLSFYSAFGGGTALFGRYTTHLGAVGVAVTF